MTNKLKDLLLEEKESLQKQINTYKTDDPYNRGKRSDGFEYDEQLTDSETHDRLTATQNELKIRLDEVVRALVKIEEGKYGDCENCSQKISEERLEAKPSARYCLDCEKKDV